MTRGRRIAAIAGGTAIAIVLLGWTTGMRDTMHEVLLGVAVVAFLPFVLIAAALFVIVLGGIAIAVISDGDAPTGGAGELVATAGKTLVSRYYRFLARQRRPAYLGGAAGTVLGGLLLWALLAIFVVPGEARTVALLAESKEVVDAAYRNGGEFPRPDADGYLPRGGDVARDGFGNPLHYEVAGARRLASYKLVSRGFDGVPDDDDLCIGGATALAAWADRIAGAAALLEVIRGGKSSSSEKLAGIRALQCPR